MADIPANEEIIVETPIAKRRVMRLKLQKRSE
jgi:hypothetical protein